ncbi:molecular chaperone DnaJ [Leptospira andrefontaineae]|uniref:Molecular chaperone DnaJ n=1 Tax=Leptospira andrefontaineae TaxID=2484976 RepID=A0A4R9H8M8_9LEPT|nr:molecular chaperone DnaJ [Leptospira andrefontaineae]TGK42400.1 molecular chaperone DnaJ [Leptospira andrefontaineae]
MNRFGTGLSRKTDYYVLFGLSRDASPQAVEDAFHRYVQTLKEHSWVPWKDAELREGAEAYYHLSDPARRKRYDSSLDYELVLPDPEGVPEEFEQYFEVQKISTPKEYERLYKQFLMLKYEREDKLWIFRATVYFILACFSALVLSSLVFVVFQKNGWLSTSADLFYRRWGLLFSCTFMGTAYTLFRVFYLERVISLREKKREIEQNEEVSDIGP